MKVVFLDRDGVINRFPGYGRYVTKVKDFHILPGVVEAIRRLTEAGCAIFVVSNQAGVAKGVYSKEKLERINRNMLDAVKKGGGRIRRVYYCTHRSDDGCECRKPGIGSINRAIRTIRSRSHKIQEKFFVGDTQSDILAGRKAGCRTIFVLSGKDSRRDLKQWTVRPDYTARTLLEATRVILGTADQRRRFRT